jgi:hypothetical protein
MKVNQDLAAKLTLALNKKCKFANLRIAIPLNTEDTIYIFHNLNTKNINLYCWYGPAPQGRNDHTNYSNSMISIDCSKSLTFEDLIDYIRSISLTVRTYLKKKLEDTCIF